ncbi:unnamed protein product [Diabrotica balteata]|uniref:Uncharacterized protein n=1 Tax=Diabrotica balteata TaxID=107213 RepID=A0A9N9T384_DIABA|nr:unnamed protein product [Diabrotica balteata]
MQSSRGKHIANLAMANENSKTTMKVEETILDSTPSSSKNPVLQNDDYDCFSLMNRTAATAIWNIPSTSTSSCASYSSEQRSITVQNKIVILSDVKIQDSFDTEIKSADKVPLNQPPTVIEADQVDNLQEYQLDDNSDDDKDFNPLTEEEGSDSTDDNEVQETCRKICRWNKGDKSQWKRHLIKKRRNLGKLHVTKEGEFPPKTPKPVNCSRCRFHCTDNFSEEERMQLCSTSRLNIASTSNKYYQQIHSPLDFPGSGDKDSDDSISDPDYSTEEMCTKKAKTYIFSDSLPGVNNKDHVDVSSSKRLELKRYQTIDPSLDYSLFHFSENSKLKVTFQKMAPSWMYSVLLSMMKYVKKLWRYHISMQCS